MQATEREKLCTRHLKKQTKKPLRATIINNIYLYLNHNLKLKKMEAKKISGTKIGGVVFFGCMFLGAGIGMLFNAEEIGGAIGMGVGSIGMGAIMANYIQK